MDTQGGAWIDERGGKAVVRAQEGLNREVRRPVRRRAQEDYQAHRATCRTRHVVQSFFVAQVARILV